MGSQCEHMDMLTRSMKFPSLRKYEHGTSFQSRPAPLRPVAGPLQWPPSPPPGEGNYLHPK